MKKFTLLLVICCAVSGLMAVEPVVDFKLNEGSGKVVKDSAGNVKGEICFAENTR